MVEPNSAIRNLIIGAAPEREDEIEAIWERCKHDVCVIQNTRGAAIHVREYPSIRIQFDVKTLEVIWLLGFSGWKSIETYSASILFAYINDITIEEAISFDEELPSFEMEYRSRLNSAKSMLYTVDGSYDTWPEDIPLPTSDRKSFSTIQEVAAFDLVLLATSFVFLHEIRHVQFVHQGDSPETQLEEEISCDVWARSFMTEKIDRYAKSVGVDFSKVLHKRSMGIAIGAMILHELTPEYERGGSKDYPSIATRIQAMVENVHLSQNDYYWLVTSGLLIGIFRRAGHSLPMKVSSYKELVEQLISMQ